VRLLTLAVVLLLALAGAGCGGGDEATSDTDTVVTETTGETTTEETTDETETGDEDTFVAGDCQEVIAASQALGQASAAAGADLDVESGDAFAEFVEEAPEEIRADVQLMAEYYDEYIAAVRDVGIEPGETPTPEQISELSQIYASADFQAYAAAAQRFNAWAAQNC
jgi:hypothetical protein